MKEKEAQFNEEKNNMWKELTDAFQKVFLSFQLGSQNCHCLTRVALLNAKSLLFQDRP